MLTKHRQILKYAHNNDVTYVRRQTSYAVNKQKRYYVVGKFDRTILMKYIGCFKLNGLF